MSDQSKLPRRIYVVHRTENLKDVLDSITEHFLELDRAPSIDAIRRFNAKLAEESSEIDGRSGAIAPVIDSSAYSRTSSHSQLPSLSSERTERVYIAEALRTTGYLNRYPNRWRFGEPNDLVNFSTERFLDLKSLASSDRHPMSRLSRQEYQNLKRIKVYGLTETFEFTKRLLYRLSKSFVALEQLEIDQLVLESQSLLEYTFLRLRTLSIDSVRLVNERGRQADGTMATVCIEAFYLDSLYLGVYHVPVTGLPIVVIR